ncbi:MAG: type II toxin-antitoxin system RelE/ParE family toxin [Bacteroidales bacterium]|nr:type II toxin-antitoxin system RelE/ParE family toxin [Bacteroidales bacterium]
MEFDKPIKVIFLPKAEEFVDALDKKSKQKLFTGIRKVKERIFGKWFTKLTSSDGIFEFRFDESNKYYRVFAFWDNEGDIETLIVCTHGIDKKTNKTPPAEIVKAERLKREYFEEKRRNKK